MPPIARPRPGIWPCRRHEKALALNIAKAGAQLQGAAVALLARPEVSSQRVGVVGFSMRGQLALHAATEYSHQVGGGGAVDFYGVHPKVRIDPSAVRVPVLAHFGKRDNSVKEADARVLVERIQSAGGDIVAHYYDHFCESISRFARTALTHPHPLAERRSAP